MGTSRSSRKTKETDPARFNDDSNFRPEDPFFQIYTQNYSRKENPGESRNIYFLIFFEKNTQISSLWPNCKGTRFLPGVM